MLMQPPNFPLAMWSAVLDIKQGTISQKRVSSVSFLFEALAIPLCSKSPTNITYMVLWEQNT